MGGKGGAAGDRALDDVTDSMLRSRGVTRVQAGVAPRGTPWQMGGSAAPQRQAPPMQGAPGAGIQEGGANLSGLGDQLVSGMSGPVEGDDQNRRKAAIPQGQV